MEVIGEVLAQENGTRKIPKSALGNHQNRDLVPDQSRYGATARIADWQFWIIFGRSGRICGCAVEALK